MLEVKNVSMLQNKKDKTILNHVSATFEEGIFYTIIRRVVQENNTLIVVSRLRYSSKGTVLCNGEDITKKG